VSDDELRDLIVEMDINKNATIEEEEFLQVHIALYNVQCHVVIQKVIKCMH